MEPIDQSVPDLPVVPPPWALRGNGYLFFYRFSERFIDQQAAISPELRAVWRGGVGALAWMDYRISQVGAYRELLFIPGRFQQGGKRQHSITRIFVESWESVVSGRANWGIPKFHSDFDTRMEEDGTETLTALMDGEPFARFQVVQQLLKLPVNTQLCPITLVQHWQGQVFQTPLRVQAAVSLLDVRSIWTDGRCLPDLSDQTPLGALKLSNFRIIFPTPTISADTLHAAPSVSGQEG